MTSANYVEDLNQGRGWLNRAAEMLDSCEDHRSDAEFARAAAAIGNGFVRLAAAEREAAAQAFVDERHAAERAEDLKRIAANRTEDLERIAAADAKAWEHQDSEAEVRDAVVEAHRAMTARMQAEQAEVEQRAGVLAALDVAALAASGQREQRAEAEARPHDDMSLHTALALGIERGLRDVGADLSGCTPSMLTGHVIRQLRDTGPWEITPATLDGEVDRG